MQLVLDVSLILITFLFSYAFGRRDSEGQTVIPMMVIWNALFLIIIIYVLINLPGILQVMERYAKR